MAKYTKPSQRTWIWDLGNVPQIFALLSISVTRWGRKRACRKEETFQKKNSIASVFKNKDALGKAWCLLGMLGWEVSEGEIPGRSKEISLAKS